LSPRHPKVREDFVSHCACVVYDAPVDPGFEKPDPTDASVLHLRPPNQPFRSATEVHSPKKANSLCLSRTVRRPTCQCAALTAKAPAQPLFKGRLIYHAHANAVKGRSRRCNQRVGQDRTRFPLFEGLVNIPCPCIRSQGTLLRAFPLSEGPVNIPRH